MVMQSSSFRTPLVQSARFRYRLAPTLPTFHDLTERSADLSPRFAGCDAGIVFSFELGTLPRRYPLFQMQLAVAMHPTLERQLSSQLLRVVCKRDFACRSGGILAERLQPWALVLPSRMRDSIIHQVRRAILLRLRLEVDASEFRVVDNVPES